MFGMLYRVRLDVDTTRGERVTTKTDKLTSSGHASSGRQMLAIEDGTASESESDSSSSSSSSRRHKTSTKSKKSKKDKKNKKDQKHKTGRKRRHDGEGNEDAACVSPIARATEAFQRSLGATLPLITSDLVERRGCLTPQYPISDYVAGLGSSDVAASGECLA